MSIVTLLPFIVLIGAMFLMTRSAKRKQAAASQMRNDVQPGTGVRTIGGMYATVKEVNDDSVVLEVAPGVHAYYAKNSIGAVLEDEEYNRIVHGEVVPDDASSLTEGEADVEADTDVEAVAEADADAEKTTDEPRIDLGKKDVAEDTAAEPTAVEPKDGKSDGGTDAK